MVRNTFNETYIQTPTKHKLQLRCVVTSNNTLKQNFSCSL